MKKVLICDDSSTDLTRLATALEDQDCFVIKSTSGVDVLGLAKRHTPNVIFLDIVMPDKDGFAICRELLNDNETKHIPIIFVSSKNKKADHVWAKMQGARALIAKPYSDKDIVAVLDTV